MAENSDAKGNGASGDKHEQHKNPYHWVYVAGFCIFSAFIDFTFLWPESPLWALLALAAVLILILIYELTVIGSAATRVALFVVMFFMLAGGTYWVIGPNLPIETEIHGWLQPANDPMPQTMCGAVRTDEYILALGSAGYVNKASATLPGIFVGDCQLVTVTRSQNGISVNATLYTEDGETLAAQIKDNEWSRAPGQTSYSDRPDRSTLAVYDKNGKELLWIKFANLRAVQVRGVFRCKCESSWTADNTGLYITGFPEKKRIGCFHDLERIHLKVTDDPLGGPRRTCFPSR